MNSAFFYHTMLVGPMLVFAHVTWSMCVIDYSFVLDGMSQWAIVHYDSFEKYSRTGVSTFKGSIFTT